MNYLVLAVCIGSAMARPDGAGGHHGHHSGGGAAPQAGYGAPDDSYAPATGYEQPTGYAPSGYEQPAYTGYTAPSGYTTGVADESGGIDLSMLLIPVFIIAGLALLFPSVVSVDVNSRKKRSTEEEISGNSLVDRVQDIYMSVVQSEECMERVACEVGGIAADAGLNRSVFNVAGAFVPTKYSKMMKTFAMGKDCHKIKCGSLF